MKKLSLFALLGTSLILVGCGNTETPTEPTDNNSNAEVVAGSFSAPICDEYFRVLDCTLQSQVPAEQQAEISAVVEQTKTAWIALDAETQTATCQAAWDNEILPQAELYNSFGCTVPVDETQPTNAEVEILPTDTTNEVVAPTDADATVTETPAE